jgi:hypothetical protein
LLKSLGETGRTDRDARRPDSTANRDGVRSWTIAPAVNVFVCTVAFRCNAVRSLFTYSRYAAVRRRWKLSAFKTGFSWCFTSDPHLASTVRPEPLHRRPPHRRCAIRYFADLLFS